MMAAQAAVFGGAPVVFYVGGLVYGVRRSMVVMLLSSVMNSASPCGGYERMEGGE
jgi:hypothetical protein